MLSTRLVFGLLMVAGLLTGALGRRVVRALVPVLVPPVRRGDDRRGLGDHRPAAATSVKPSGNSVIGGVLAIVVANWVPHLIENHSQADGESALLYDPGRPLDILAWPFLTFIAVLMACFVVQSIQFARPGRTMAKISGTVLAVAYVGLLGSFTIQMRWFEGRHQGLMALRLPGRDGQGRRYRRLHPRPAGRPAQALAAAQPQEDGRRRPRRPGLRRRRRAPRDRDRPPTGSASRPSTGPSPPSTGSIIAAVAQLGDLMESMIKRDCERKDASQAVPGFGGVLDVLDSLMFAGPVAYALWLSFGP